MNYRGSDRRSSIVIGGILIAVGAIFLIGRQLNIDVGRTGWPVFVIVPGIVLFLLAFAVGGQGGSGGRIRGLDAVLAASLVVLGLVIVVFSLRPARRAR